MTRLTLPRPGLGTSGNDDPEQCATTVETALDVGYRHVDTAQMYDNEAAVGRGLERSPIPRDDVVVASKVHPENLAPDDVLTTAKESLDRLGLDAIDLMYVHWPAVAYDPERTLPAFDELVDRGAVRHVGVSNFSPALLDEAMERLDAPIAAHQVEMHPLFPQAELVAHAEEHGYALVAYAPLGQTEVLDVPEIRTVAERRDATPAQVCLAWLMSHDPVVPIPKSTGEAHLRENVEARSIELTDEDLATIDGIAEERRLVDPPWGPWN